MSEFDSYYRHLNFLKKSLPVLTGKYIGKRASFDQSQFTREPEPAIIEGTIEAIDLAEGDASEYIPPFLRATIRVSPTTTHLVDLDVVSVAMEENQ